MNNSSMRAKIKYRILSALFIFGTWTLLTLFFPPLVVPRISSVAKELSVIFTTGALYKMIALTTLRLTIGLSIGVLFGLIIGILMGRFKSLKEILLPIIGIFQTVPPVSWVVLALVWFGFNGKPAIFIVVTSTIPIVAINVCNGILNIDNCLLQMAKLYRFSESKQMKHVILPSIYPYFRSAFQVALGTGWKIAVMGEVLTTSDGIGGMIKLARLNIEPENVIAWSIVVVALFYISDYLLNKIFSQKRRKRF